MVAVTLDAVAEIASLVPRGANFSRLSGQTARSMDSSKLSKCCCPLQILRCTVGCAPTRWFAANGASGHNWRGNKPFGLLVLRRQITAPLQGILRFGCGISAMRC